MVDSLPGAIPVYFTRGEARADAAHLQALANGCVAMYRDSVTTYPRVELAVLDSAAWVRVTSMPYGVPVNSGPATRAVVLVPARVRAGPPLRFHGTPPAEVDRFFHLLALHELGHLLTWAIVGVHAGSSVDGAHFPGWYYEFAATYIALTCLTGHPAEAQLLRGSERHSIPRRGRRRRTSMTSTPSWSRP